MIIAKQKPLQELWEMINKHKKVLVLACNTCVAVCHAGGNKEAEVISSLLRMQAIQNYQDIEIIHSGVEKQCEQEHFEEIKTHLQWAEAVLSTACGAGVQFLAEKYPNLPVYPALNTCFLGATEKIGLWTERCQACGHCILDKTAGICPVSRCAKRLLNGPCGGSTQGKCEINKDLDCAWQLIIDRLKKFDKLDNYEQLISIKDWSKDRAGGPRKVTKEGENSF